MTYKKITFFFIAFFLVSFSISYLLEGATEKKELDKKIEYYLKGVEIKNLRLKSDENFYSAKKGKIFKGEKEIKEKKATGLALFYQETLEDPLFVGPGFEGKKFKETLQKYEEEKEVIKKTTGFKADIMPVAFLAMLPEVEKSQNEFLTEKSEEKGEKLIEAYKEAGRLYYKEAARFKKNIEEKGLGNVFVLLSGLTTDRELILNDIEIILENAEAIKKEIEKREKCLSGNLESCERKGLGFKKPERKKERETKKEIGLLQEDELFFASDEEEKIESGPYKIETECFKKIDSESGGKQHVYVLTEKIPVFPKKIYKTVKSAANNFYAIQYNGDYKRFFGEDIAWTPIPDANPYTCTNFEYIPEAVTLDKVYILYKEKRLYEEIKNLKNNWPEEIKNLMEEGEFFENKFFNEKIPSYQDLQELSSFYAYAYSYLNLNKNEELDKYKNEFLKRHLFIDRELGDFDLIFNNFSFNIIDYYKNNYIKEEPFDEGYLYSLRTAYSITYLPFSPSMWRIEKDLTYYMYFKGGTNNDFMDYQEALQKYEKKEIKGWKDDLLKIFYEYDRLFFEKSGINEEGIKG